MIHWTGCCWCNCSCRWNLPKVFCQQGCVSCGLCVCVAEGLGLWPLCRFSGLPASELPKTESLKITVDRVLPFWESDIVPAIRSGKKVSPALAVDSFVDLLLVACTRASCVCVFAYVRLHMRHRV